MKFAEFSQHSDAFHDAKGDLDWARLMALLDQGDLLGAGQYLDKHFGGAQSLWRKASTGRARAVRWIKL